MRRLLPYLALASIPLFGCKPPDTPFRYTALTPAARPITWDGRGSPGGTVHAEGHASTTGSVVGLFPKTPAPHDTALLVTRVSLDGALLLEPIRGVQVGMRASYASYEWAHESTIGTMPLPERPPLWGIGPEFRVWFPFDRRERFALGIAGNALFYQVPFAEWTRQECAISSNCIATTVWPEGGPRRNVTFELTRQGVETRVVLNGGLYPSFGIGDHARYGNVFALVAVTQGFSNDGFTDERSSDGKLSTYAVPILGAGYGFRFDWAHVNMGFFWPIVGGDAPVRYGPGAWLSIGFDPRLWRGEGKIGAATQ